MGILIGAGGPPVVPLWSSQTTHWLLPMTTTNSTPSILDIHEVTREILSMTMPNFLIIGAMRCGTTTMYHLLRQHPEIYMSPVKEPRFFAIEGQSIPEGQVWTNSVNELTAYQALFKQVSGEKAIGEASPLYLYSESAPERIRHYIPEAKLIAILRHPAERAYSHFLHHRRLAVEPLPDFSAALDYDDTHRQFQYKDLGYYSIQLKRYFDVFQKSQIKVCLYDDFDANPLEFLQEIFRFLEVDTTFVPNSIPRHNQSTVPKNRLLDAFLSSDNLIQAALRAVMPASLWQQLVAGLKTRNLSHAIIAPDLRTKLNEVYRKDILQLQHLIQRDLSKWLQ
jgi:hypothetical protein